MNDRQMQVAGILAKAIMSVEADTIAAHMGYKPARSGRLAVSKTLRAMECAGIVFRSPPRDRWDRASWGLTGEGRAALNPSPQPRAKG